MTKGLFDDHTHVRVFRVLAGLVHALLAELVNDLLEVLRRDRKIKEPVTLGPLFLVDLAKRFVQPLVAIGVVEVSSKVTHLLHERIELGILLGTGVKDRLLHVRCEGL